MMKITKRAPNVIDLMKIGFLFMVIFLHALDEETRFIGAVIVQELPAGFAWMREALTQHVFRCAVPGFYMISAALLYQKEFFWKENLKKKFRRLMVPYLLLNTLWLVVCLVGRKIDALAAYFASEGTDVYRWGAWQWLNAYAGFDGEPLAYHLWFLRDLFVLNVLAGGIKWVIDHQPRLTLAVLLALYALGAETQLFCLRMEALCFFCLGYYVVKYPALLARMKAIPMAWLSLGYAVTVALAMLAQETAAAQLLHAGAVVVGLCFWWRLASCLAGRLRGHWLYVLMRHGYGIYLFHEMTLTILRKLCVRVSPALIWLTPVVVIAACCAVCVLLARYQPGVYELLTGETLREKMHVEAA